MQSLEGLVIGVLCAGCATGPTTTPSKEAVPIAPLPTVTDTVVDGLAPATLIGDAAAIGALDKAIETHFTEAPTRRSYLMTDKPLYQPGEAIWFRVDLRSTSTLLGAQPVGLTMQLVSPRGAVVMQKQVLAQAGIARNDFQLGDEIEGGEYTLTLQAEDGTRDAKQLVINTYEAPRLMKTLEFVRKAYGAGDAVTAAIEIKRTTGEAFADQRVTAVVTIDDAETARLPLKTDHDGKVLARFKLPAQLVRGDGLLTILVEDGGVTESIQKRIPIVMKTLHLDLLPEGGELVEGLSGRVYFMAKTTIGKPADLEGKLVDDRGAVVTELASIHDGMGRFEIVPAPGRRYHVEITKPAGIEARFEVPIAKPSGCVIRSLAPRTLESLRFAAICSTAQTLLVEAVLREKRIGGGAVELEAGKPAVIELPVDAAAEGVARVTLFSKQQVPLAERLVYHGRGADLRIAITADKPSYSPRDPVRLHIHTTDAHGRPVKASLGLAVVDETVLSFADDKTAGILAHLLLEPELGATAEDPINEPNYYFSDQADAPAALDALLATRGYRRFEWRPIVDHINGAAGSQP